MEALIAYLEDHPLIALLLAVVAVAVVWSLVKQILKMAVFLAIVLGAGLYFTHQEAQEDWKAQGRALFEKARDGAGDLLDKGREALEEGVADECVRRIFKIFFSKDIMI